MAEDAEYLMKRFYTTNDDILVLNDLADKKHKLHSDLASPTTSFCSVGDYFDDKNSEDILLNENSGQIDNSGDRVRSEHPERKVALGLQNAMRSMQSTSFRFPSSVDVLPSVEKMVDLL